MPKKSKGLKPYMASDENPAEWAILVFAHNIKEARKIAWPALMSFGADDYLNMRVKYLAGEPELLEQADPAKLASGTPHVIESPATCNTCEKWGEPLNPNGDCKSCEKEKNDAEWREEKLSGQ